MAEHPHANRGVLFHVPSLPPPLQTADRNQAEEQACIDTAIDCTSILPFLTFDCFCAYSNFMSIVTDTLIEEPHGEKCKESHWNTRRHGTSCPS